MDYHRYDNHHSTYTSSKYSQHQSSKHHQHRRHHEHHSRYHSPSDNRKSSDSYHQKHIIHLKKHSPYSRHHTQHQQLYYHHNHYSNKRTKLERSRGKSSGSSQSSKYHSHYHNKYNRHIHPRTKPTLNSYKSNSNYSSNKSSSGLSSKRRMDKEHYEYSLGEIVGGRFKLLSFISDGTFGRVLTCEDIQSSSKSKYAIKIIRPVKRYIESAEIEANIIMDINEKDKAKESYCIQMIDAFHFKKVGEEYYAIIFERVGLSLFEFIKDNNYRGFTIKSIQRIAYQILKGIGYLHRNGIIHTDLKPENVLLVDSAYTSSKDKSIWPINVLHKEEKLHIGSPSTRSYSKENEESYHFLQYNNIKIIDFGGAVYSRQDRHGTINTRQYRSPEVIMECFEWDEKSDVWSIACILSELYTGELLFSTHENIEHLCLIEKVCGSFPDEMAKNCCSELKGLFVPKLKGKEVVARVDHHRANNYSKIAQALKEQETLNELIHPEHFLFSDLLYSMLKIDPRERLSCFKALEHSFFKHNYDN